MEDLQVTLYRTRFRHRWSAKPPFRRRRNDLSPAVGLLELSNALDFAANVWNAIPPPVISMVFMALGATGALIILAFAAVDIPRTLHNITLLRQERRQLLLLQGDVESVTSKGLSLCDVQAYLDMNSRELGNEVIDRLAMGLLLGFGALTVGIGTYLAIDGANPTSYLASNIITGYVGNVPAALYGLMNATWCIYGWRRAHRHANTAAEAIRTHSKNAQSSEIATEIQRHSKRVKLHAFINGISGIMGGAGSLMTASAYIHPIGVWGYVILIPCVISAFTVNVYWRLKVNYDRDIEKPIAMDAEKVLNDAGYALSCERTLSEFQQASNNRGLRSRDKKVDRNLLEKFLLNYYTVTAEWLTTESKRLTEKLESLNRGESSKEGHDIPTITELLAQREKAQEYINRCNSLLNVLRTSKEKSEKQITVEDLLDALCDPLISTDLFSQFCVRLANDSTTAVLIGKNIRNAQQLNINSSVLRQQSTESREHAAALLEVACKTLLRDGLRRARARTRYYCELCGCTFGQLGAERWKVHK